MIVAVTMVRDEDDILEWTLGHMLTQVDHVIVADNLSTDRTRAIAESFDRVTVKEDNEVGYYQAEKMTALAHEAGRLGAEWVVPFDADEAWFLPDLRTIDADVVTARPYVYVPRDPECGSPITGWHWRQPASEPQPKVLFRYHEQARLHMGQHGVDRPGRQIEAASCRHYQYRSLEQVARKVRQGAQAYEATDLPGMYGTHWKELAALTDEQLEQWWNQYLTQELVYAP